MRRLLVAAALLVVAAAGVLAAWRRQGSVTSAAPTMRPRVPGRLSCGGVDGLPTFTVASLHGPALAHSVVFGDAPGKAVWAWLGKRYGTPREGVWVMILREPAQVTYMRRLNDLLADVSVSRKHGRWTVTGWGLCVPRYQGSLAWEIGTLPDPAAMSFVIGYTTGAKCNGPTHELLPLNHVDVRETSDGVQIAVYLEQDLPPPGWKPLKNTGCSAVGFEARTTVTLASPIGTRRLLDGGLVPPAPVMPVSYGP